VLHPIPSALGLAGPTPTDIAVALGVYSDILDSIVVRSAFVVFGS
jgi:hypothetical protein